MKFNFIIIILFICLNSGAGEYVIEKYETQLQQLETKKTIIVQTKRLKVLKGKQVILEKYYNELQRVFDYQMKTKNLTLANKINAKKDEIYALYQNNKDSIANPLKKIKDQRPKLFHCKGIIDERYPGSRLLVTLKIGGRCFKAEGKEQSHETWKTIPKFLLGKKISYLSRDSSIVSSKANYRVSKAGYLYFVSSHRENGAEEVGRMSSIRRTFYVYKHYLYKSNGLYLSTQSGSEGFAIFEP